MFFLFLYFICVSLFNPVIYGFNVSNYILVISFLLLLVLRNVKLRIFSRNSNSAVICYLFYIIIAITIIYSSDKTISLIIYLKLGIPIIFTIILLNVVKTKDNFLRLINLIVYTVMILSIYGFIQYYFGIGNYYLERIGSERIIRATGTFKQSNVLASFIVLSIPFIVYKISICKGKLAKCGNIFILIISLVCLYFTFSRWAIICVVITFGGYAVKKYVINLIKKGIKLNRYNVLFFMICCIGMYFIYKYVNDLYLLFVYRGSNTMRQNNLLMAYDVFKNHIWGMGLGNGNVGFILDSTYMQLLVDTGIIGFLAFTAMMSVLYFQFKKISKQDSYNDIYNITKISLMIFIINCFLETILYNSLINIFLGIYLFILNVDSRILQNTSEVN
ncbi:MAG: hypothetical protein Q8936_14860 [Bacillota bacterium]|nr:hypothetical protein [Bacillota bacterium]